MMLFQKEHRIDLFSTSAEPNSLYSLSPLFKGPGGQMFGVLLCRDRTGTEVLLRAFSGRFNGVWEVDGWVGPVQDPRGYDGVLAEADAEVADLNLRYIQADTAEDRTLLKKLRCEVSGEYTARLQEQFAFQNFLGESRGLPGIFGHYPLPGESGGESFSVPGIPGGTGECCLPKLLNAAVLRGLEPIDAAEFYWGRGNPAGTRQHGRFYPPCREKCRPILGFICRGLSEGVVERLTGESPGLPEKGLDILYADDFVVVVNKPSGLLSVPGRGPAGQDSVVSRLQRLFPSCPGHPEVHRLDMDTSGVMVYALDSRSQRILSKQFQRRSIQKEYIALLDGQVHGSSGVISLSFRLDPENRPLQVWDPKLGKEGVTGWSLLGLNADNQSLVLFRPFTGRTHQLRVHSAHPLGIGASIVGDRLYGKGVPGQFLHLHAAALTFRHPGSNQFMTFRSPPPFLSEKVLRTGTYQQDLSLFVPFLP